MKFLNSLISSTADIAAIGIGATIITVFSYLFYADISKSVNIGDAELVGTITYKRKVAQRKYSSQVVWEDVSQNTPVYNMDSIRTAGMSEAVITLSDGTKINIDENSMILLALNKDQINIEFSYGSLLANRDDTAPSGAKKLTIKSDQATVSLDKGDIKMDKAEGKELNLTVREGAADITTLAGVKKIDRDQKVVLASGSEDAVLYDLNLKLTSPLSNSYFFTREDEMEIKFSWEEVKGEFDVYLEIAKDREFSDFEFQKEVSGNSRAVELDIGTYNWRLKAVNRVTKKTEYSDSRKLNIIYDDPLQLISPENREQFTYRNNLPILHFKWSRSEIASAYRLLIAKDSAMKNIVKTVEAPGESAAIDTLTRGDYFWRVEKVLPFKGVSYVSTSKTFQFSITQKEIVDPPLLIYPPNNKRISRVQLEKESVTFTWKKSPQTEGSKLFIARDKDFRDVVFSSETSVNFIKLDEELPTGAYYWRVTGIIEDEEETSPSSTRIFSVIKTETVKLILPRNNETIVPGEEEKYPSIRFAWERSDISGKYRIQIARDENFSAIYNESVNEASTYKVPEVRDGKYFWRVELLDLDDSVLLKSGVQSFSVKGRLEAPLVIAPKNGHVVDMADKNILSLDWEDVENADLYTVELYSIKKERQIPVANIRIKSSKVKITDLKKLDIGRFRWTVQAFETAEGGRKIIRKSKAVQNDFEIILSKKMEKIDIESLKIEGL